MGYKIGTLTVSVTPDDDGFEAELREQVKDATDGVRAEVSLRLNQDAVISLDEDVKSAIDLVEEDAKVKVGLRLNADSVEALDGDVKAATDLVGEDAKVKVSVDKDAAKKDGEEGGGLLMAAIAAGAGLGAPLLLAVTGAAFAGVTALGLKSNKVIAADYTQLGKSASAALTQATAPLAGVMNQNLQSLEGSLKGLQPQLDGLFQNVGPDITSVTGGVVSLATNALPGLTDAVNSSHADVQGFANGLGSLGTGVGGFFTGLTRDASTTGAGLQSFLSLAGSTVSTLGTVLGSASSAISADLMAIVPPTQAVLSAIDKLANPATVGALAGGLGMKQFGSSIKSGLQSASDSVLKFGADVEGMGGGLSRLAPAAESTSLGLSKMAGVMGGPWGIAIGAGIGLASGLAGVLFNAAHASDAVTLSTQGLTQAVQQDGAAAGSATAAYVAQQAAASGLSTIAANAGVSMATWTQAVLGSKSAQEAVVATVNTANQVVQNQAKVTTDASVATGKYTQDLHDARTSAADGAAANDTLTAANQKLINSMRAETAQVAASIAQTSKYEEAMNQIVNVQSIFNATLTAGYKAMVATAQSSALTTVGALNLGNAQYSLTSSLNSTVTAYDESVAEGSAYNQVLSAMSGNVNSMLGSEAAFTTALSGVTAAVKANGTSLDVNTAKGAANITSFTGIATAADKAATAVYQNESTTKGSTIAWNDANAKLNQMKTAFEQAAEQAGVNKNAVVALANELFKLPKNVPINIPLTVSGLASVQSKIESVVGGSSSGHVVGPSPHLASGGDVTAGHAYTVGDGGRTEVFVPDTSGWIYPTVGQGDRAIAQHNAQLSSPAGRSSGAGTSAGGHTTVQNFYGSALPSIEQAANMKRQLALTVGIG